jgi:hypothetical protein
VRLWRWRRPWRWAEYSVLSLYIYVILCWCDCCVCVCVWLSRGENLNCITTLGECFAFLLSFLFPRPLWQTKYRAIYKYNTERVDLSFAAPPVRSETMTTTRNSSFPHHRLIYMRNIWTSAHDWLIDYDGTSKWPQRFMHLSRTSSLLWWIVLALSWQHPLWFPVTIL